MITDRQVRMLMSLIQKNKSLAVAAAKAGMDEKTARKYRDMPRPPSEVIPQHYWKTRSDPFLEVWEEVHPLLKDNPGLEAKTIFEYLQRKYPGRFADGQLRTLQRKIKVWRAREETRARILAETQRRGLKNISRVEIRFQGPFCYLDAYERESAVPTHLCRLRYFSGRNPDSWSVAFYTSSHEKYEPCVFPSGKWLGTPEEGFEVGSVYLS